jgi:predicted nuclease with TOPRIM domain
MLPQTPSQKGTITELVEQENDVENSLRAVHSEMKEMTTESISSLSEKLDAACNDSTSRLVKLNSRLDTLQEQVTVADHVAAQHTVRNRLKD